MSLQSGQTLKDRYEVVKVLGEGGMGTVYLVQDHLMLGRVRALKELYPDPLADETKLLASRAQFEREAQALEKLRHPNLPHVSDYFSIDENDYLVMDYIAGESLGDLLSRQERPSEREICDWIAQILSALEYCHDHNVLHRDIKPANLILTPDGKLMLVDFSLVKLLDPHNPRTATIVRGVGTPQYTPLEQYDASMGHTDARSDIYALGATIYHLLSGRAPQPVSQRILNPDTQPALQELKPDLSPWMAKFVQKAMTIHPQDRYQSVGEMRQELETQVFKLKPPAKTKNTIDRQPAKPEYERKQVRYRVTTATHIKRARKTLRRSAPRVLPVLMPMLVPITVVLGLAVLVAFIFSMGSSLVTAVIATPLVFSALIYYRLVSGRNDRPSKF